VKESSALRRCQFNARPLAQNQKVLDPMLEYDAWRPISFI
jgi:hypothetical protein